MPPSKQPPNPLSTERQFDIDQLEAEDLIQTEFDEWMQEFLGDRASVAQAAVPQTSPDPNNPVAPPVDTNAPPADMPMNNPTGGVYGG